MLETTNSPIIDNTKVRFNSFLGSKVLFVVKIIFAVILVAFISAFGSGLLTAINPLFDPTSALAYFVLAYFLGNLYHLNQKQNTIYFATSLFLSYFASFVSGSLFLLLIIPALKLARVISTSEIKQI
ncbi:MAG: hypothetical protein WC069_05500 [Candidatus Shapirobacteria bacterium]